MAALALGIAAALGACARLSRAPHSSPDDSRDDAPDGAARWVATWSAAPQRVEPHNLPPAPGLAGRTLRQVVHLSLPARQLRVRLSNEYGTGPLAIGAARVARAHGPYAADDARRAAGATVAGTDRALTFAGRAAVTIPPGAIALSDPVALDVPALGDLAVSVHVTAAPPEVTGHPGSRATSWLQAGDHTASPALQGAVRVEHWYLLAGVEAVPPPALARRAAVVVAIGNSITDGRDSGTDRNRRWPDLLAARLAANPRTRHVGVVNAGIGGNAVLAGGLGPTVQARFARDVLAVPGARWVIVLAGVNDIGGARPSDAMAVAERLVAAHARLAQEARARGLVVLGATLPPFGGSFYDAPEREAARQALNRWIRTGGAYDAVVDFDAAVRDPARPSHLLPAADGGDHLHPGPEGYARMAAAIDLARFGAPAGR